MKRKGMIIAGFLFLWLAGASAVQKEIGRIERMSSLPEPYRMRDWKEVARTYDCFVFDRNRSGEYLPLTEIHPSGVNYPASPNIRMDTYVGSYSHGRQAEAINILPALVGATLVGIDKTAGEVNWVRAAKDFYNSANGQDVYLNGYAAASGSDWWYDVMPNIYFYQLYFFYPEADPDFGKQFVRVADRWLDAVEKLGGSWTPRTLPDMNYRAFNLATGKPLVTGVKEPEAAGGIAWILYQAYRQTGDRKYFEGAQLVLEFLDNYTENPSYELQLPYGTVIAARMNAEEGCEFFLEKYLNWCFDRGPLRGWGAITGQWGGIEVSGLIGEANDAGDDYAFVMNGFQQAAALMPVAKYDKRYARALGKWLLNLANASRLFYRDGLDSSLQEPKSYEWLSRYDADACLPYESLKEVWNGQSPFAMGDAGRNGWAATDVSLYSGSSVGYLGALIGKTDVEGILQVDVNKTDFGGPESYPSYLYYNPYSSDRTVSVVIAEKESSVDLYDMISEKVVAQQVSGSCQIIVPADGARLIVCLPAGTTMEPDGRFLRAGGRVVDYHYGYRYDSPLRIKAMKADKSLAASGEKVQVYVYAGNIPSGASVLYEWSVNGETVTSAYEPGIFSWTAPEEPGRYVIRAKGRAHGEQAEDSVVVAVVKEVYEKPEVLSVAAEGEMPLAAGSVVKVKAEIGDESPDMTVSWKVLGGELEGTDPRERKWTLPDSPGVYTVSCTAANLFGETAKETDALVKNDGYTGAVPVIYYPLNGDFHNEVSDRFGGTGEGCVFATDATGNAGAALHFVSESSLFYTPAAEELNFRDALFIGCWVSVAAKSSAEQFLVSHGSWEERYKLSITPEGILRWTVKTDQGVKDLDFDEPLRPGRFYYVGAAFTGYSLELYVDGRFCGFVRHGGEMGVTDKDLTYGRKDRGDEPYCFTGVLDEIRIYNGELSLSEIARLPESWDLASTEAFVNGEGLNVYVSGRRLYAESSGEKITGLDFISLQGTVVPLVKEKTASGCTADVSAFAPGIYLVRVRLESGTNRSVRVSVK